MTPFEYRGAGSVEEALALLARYGDDAHLIAGGTSLVIMMKQGLVQPKVVVGLRRVDALRGIGPGPNGSLEIGAMTTHREVERSALASSFFGPLCETFSRIATIRIRNQATVGGNLVHADPAQDPPPMLLALDAEALVARDGGTRTIPLAEFFRDYFETALEEGEIVTGVRIPALPPGTRGAYLKYLPQTEDDYATVSVACVLRADADGNCEDVRIGLGGAAAVPLRVRRAEAALIGRRLTAGEIAEAAAIVREDVDPIDDLRGSAAYKREMARVWTERALLRLAGIDADVAPAPR